VSFLERLNNIYVIDTKMDGFDNYCSGYLVEGKEIALIDTGMANQSEAVRAGIKAHGFSVSDISYIFVTHCEHLDHMGNVAPLLKESPRAYVYINPVGLKYLTNPSIEWNRLKRGWTKEMVAKRVEPQPVPLSRIKFLNDGDVFDLGNYEKLKIIFAPGHQPSGIVILEDKNMGLFVNDLVGVYLADADVHYPITPFRSDIKQAIESLQKLADLQVANLYLGHYGICQRPKQIMARALSDMQKLLDIGIKCINEGKPESIAIKMYEMILPELEKLRLARGEALYQHSGVYHIPSHTKIFTKYCEENLKNGLPRLL
jgi:glyoxylase-like metal-dependent hydrolase (beta-lactamase superfamily II)